jgi:hypothetical protein
VVGFPCFRMSSLQRIFAAIVEFYSSSIDDSWCLDVGSRGRGLLSRSKMMYVPG